MLDPGFGIELFDDDNEIIKLLRTAGPHPSDSARILYNMAYEVTTGIYDHTKNSAPLSVELLKDAERYDFNSSLFKAMSRYSMQGIKEKFGLSLIEYLELPKDYINMLTEISSREITRRTKEHEDLERRLRQN